MPSDVALLLTAWVLASPFAVALLVGGVGAFRRLLARAYPAALALGWLGAAMLVGGALAREWTVMAAGAPFAGLAIWSPGPDGRDDDDGDDDEEPTPDREPGVDWDAFDRARRDYAGDRPRVPTPA